MSNPSFVTSENVKFDGTTANAVVLRDASGVRDLILWDSLSAADQQILTDFINNNGGTTPVSGGTAGYAVGDFGTAAGSAATGLSAATATAGKATVSLGGTAVGSAASGLSAGGTHGHQAATFSAITANTGLANDATVYTATYTIDGVAKPVSVVGSAVQTWTLLTAALVAAVGSAGTVAVTSTAVTVTSATVGLSSKVLTAPGTLFPALTGFTVVTAAVNGTGEGRNYGATITVDGVVKSVLFSGLQGATFTQVVSQINTDLGSAATAAITGGNIVITSATSNSNSSVAIADSGALFSSLTGYAGITPVAGTSPVTYTASVVVDGVAKPVSVVGSAAQTFTTLTSAITTAVGAAATVTFTSGKLKIVSATTGASSSVAVNDHNLFASVTGFKGFAVTEPGITDMYSAFQTQRSPNGARYSEVYRVLHVGVKPAVLPNTPHSSKFIYFDGTAWLYQDDDTPFCV